MIEINILCTLWRRRSGSRQKPEQKIHKVHPTIMWRVLQSGNTPGEHNGEIGGSGTNFGSGYTRYLTSSRRRIPGSRSKSCKDTDSPHRGKAKQSTLLQNQFAYSFSHISHSMIELNVFQLTQRVTFLTDSSYCHYCLEIKVVQLTRDKDLIE